MVFESSHGMVAIAFSPNGEFLASADEGGHVSVWNLQTAKLVHKAQKAEGGLRDCYSLAFTPDGESVLYSVDGKSITFWNIKKAAEEKRIVCPNGTLLSFCLSRNGDTLAIEFQDPRFEHMLSIVEVVTKKTIQSHVLATKPGVLMKATPHRLVFSIDSKLIAASSWSDRVQVFDLKKNKPLHEIKGEQVPVLALSLSPDGKFLAAGYGGNDDNGFPVDCRWRVWRVGTGEELHGSREFQAKVVALGFSIDGRLLLSGGSDGSINITEAASGGEISGTDMGMVRALCPAPDGKSVAIGTSSGQLYTFSLTPPEWTAPKGKLGKEELALLWSDLASSDADKAIRAVWTLSSLPAQAVPLFVENVRLPPGRNVKPKSEVESMRLIRELDNNDFLIREKASTTLEELGKDVETLLERSLGESKSEEMRTRIKKLLRLLEPWNIKDAEVLRMMRVIWVLERIGGKDALEMMTRIAESGWESRVKTEAELARQRLGK
jgi:WD40 repeat protein